MLKWLQRLFSTAATPHPGGGDARTSTLAAAMDSVLNPLPPGPRVVLPATGAYPRAHAFGGDSGTNVFDPALAHCSYALRRADPVFAGADQRMAWLAARRAVIDAPLACRPRVCMIYSDLGAIMLGMVVESVTGMGLDEYLEARVFGPIGMTATGFRPDASLRAQIAPTELAPPRGYPLRGEVHDENAYALGGVAGHAGLFSTAADLSMFAQMMLNGGEYAAGVGCIRIGKDEVTSRQRRDHVADQRVGTQVLRERQIMDICQEILFIDVVPFLQAA